MKWREAGRLVEKMGLVDCQDFQIEAWFHINGVRNGGTQTGPVLPTDDTPSFLLEERLQSLTVFAQLARCVMSRPAWWLKLDVEGSCPSKSRDMREAVIPVRSQMK